MKKTMLLMLCVLLLTGCQATTRSKEAPIELQAREVVERLQNQKSDTFLFYITTNSCYSCEQYANVINELQKEKPFTIYYLTIDLNEDDEDVKEALNELEVAIGNYTTFPMTYYFYKGNVQPENVKEGYIEKEDYKKWLKDLHVL